MITSLVQVYIYCDHPGCEATAQFKAGTKALGIRKAREAGWFAAGDFDCLCPEHAAAKKAGAK